MGTCGTWHITDRIWNLQRWKLSSEFRISAEFPRHKKIEKSQIERRGSNCEAVIFPFRSFLAKVS